MSKGESKYNLFRERCGVRLAERQIAFLKIKIQSDKLGWEGRRLA